MQLSSASDPCGCGNAWEGLPTGVGTGAGAGIGARLSTKIGKKRKRKGSSSKTSQKPRRMLDLDEVDLGTVELSTMVSP